MLSPAAHPKSQAQGAPVIRPPPAAATPDYRSFWQGERRLPSEIERAPPSAILVKNGGGFPAFWEPDGSFTAVMEELYLRVHEKNKGVL